MFKVNVRNKLLLVLAFGSVHTAVPMQLSKLKAFKNLSKSFVESAAKSTVQMVQDNLNWEDAVACAVVGVISYLAYKNWASDNVIKARYEAEVKNMDLKLRFAESASRKIELKSFSAAHTPNFGLDEDGDAADEEGYKKLEDHKIGSFKTVSGITINYILKRGVNRGLLWDDHRAFIEEEQEFSDSASGGNGGGSHGAQVGSVQKQIDAKSTAEIIALETDRCERELAQAAVRRTEEREQELKSAKEMNSQESPVREGLGL